MNKSERPGSLKKMTEPDLARVVGGLAPPALNSVNIIVHGFGLIFGAVKNKAGELQPGVTLMLPDDPSLPMPHKHLVGAFYDKKEAVTPIDADQAYRFVNLAREDDFPDLDLSVDARNAFLDPGNIMTDGFDSRRRIILPNPSSVLSLRCRARSDQQELISGTDVGVLLTHPTKIAIVHVLTYKIANPAQDVQLLDEKGELVFTVSLDSRDPGATTGNCHFFNEPEYEADIGHARMTFKLFEKLTKINPRVALHLDFNIDTKNGLFETDCKDMPGPGIQPDDLLTLAERRHARQPLGIPGANCIRLMLIP